MSKVQFSRLRSLAIGCLLGGLMVVPKPAAAGGLGFFDALRGTSDVSAPEKIVVRGQSSDPYYGGGDPFGGGTGGSFPAGGDPFLQPGPIQAPGAGFDPFAPQAGYGAPAFGPQQQPSFGVNGPQPYRYGWKEAIDVALMSPSDTEVDDFTFNEANFEKQWVGRGPYGNTVTVSPQYNLRWAEGPSGPPGLRGTFHRIGLGLKIGTPMNAGGLGYEIGFNPALASDFDQSFTSDAWQFDGHVAAFLRTRPTWMWVLGVAYWDRVDDIFIPYAGAVWTPSDTFEARLLFPKAKLEAFLGTPYGVPTWAYVTGEYHVESFEVSFQSPGPATPSQAGMQLSDWRIMGGARWETGWIETFAEAGIVFEREVKFSQGGPDFDPDAAFLARVGVKF